MSIRKDPKTNKIHCIILDVLVIVYCNNSINIAVPVIVVIVEKKLKKQKMKPVTQLMRTCDRQK